VWELSVIDDCNTDGEVGSKECKRLSGVVCNPNKYRHRGIILYAFPYFNIKTNLIATKKYSSFASAVQAQLTRFCCQLQKARMFSEGSFTALSYWFMYHYVAGPGYIYWQYVLHCL
jgi:hypothetical protein